MKEKRNDYKLVFEQQKRFLLKSCSEFDQGDESEAIRIAGHLRTILHDSFQKTSYDTKLIDIVCEIRQLIELEEFKNKKKALNQLNGLRLKLIQQQRKQIHSKSIMTQFNLRDKLQFIDTSLARNSFSFYTINSLTNTTIISKSYYGLLAKEVNVTKEGKEMLKYRPLCLHNNAQPYFDSCPILIFDDWWQKHIYDNGEGIVLSRKDLVIYVANLDGYAHVDEYIENKYQNFKEANILENFINSNKKEKVNLATLNSIRQIAYEVLLTMNNINSQ